jgi:hypothetical protein
LGDACPKFGTLGRASRDGARRVKGCGDPVARGRRNRAKGDAKARHARRVLGIVGANSRHEEHWGGAFRVEVKSGAQVSPVVTRYKSARAQSDASRAVGDVRPFVLVCMPDDERSGLVVVELDVIGELIASVRETGHLD